MARVFFPTYTMNRFGVRDTDQRATLGAVNNKFYQEPTPRSAMTPTPPMLGMMPIERILPIRGNLPIDSGGAGPIYWGGPPSVEPIVGPIQSLPPNPVPLPLPGPARTWMPPVVSPPIVPIPIAPISSSGGGGAVASPPPPPPSDGAPPVSTQVGPTPTVTMPPPSSGIILVSSGGGTQTPSTPVITAAPAAASATGFVDGVAAWLGGSTMLFNYNVPNALLAGIVVLGFAWLSSSSGKKR